MNYVRLVSTLFSEVDVGGCVYIGEIGVHCGHTVVVIASIIVRARSRWHQDAIHARREQFYCNGKTKIWLKILDKMLSWSFELSRD